MMNATETGNLTLKLQPNGITIIEGQSILVTKGGVGGNNSSGTEQQENATAMPLCILKSEKIETRDILLVAHRKEMIYT